MAQSAFDLIDRLEQRADRLAEHTIVAPVLEAGEVRISTLIEQTPYHLDVVDAAPGWWELRPLDDRQARIVGQPLPARVVDYLYQLPAFRVIAVYRLGRHSWLVYPWNAGDARQRGWPTTEATVTRSGTPVPRPMHLVTAPTIRPFDVIVARDLNGQLLYDQYDHRTVWPPLARRSQDNLASEKVWGQDAGDSGGLPQSFGAATSLHRARWEMEKQERERQRQASIETRLQDALAYSGAELRSWDEEGNGFRVRWQVDGEEFSTQIGRDEFVRSAGICLSGRDADYSLSAIVHVMRNRDD